MRNQKLTTGLCLAGALGLAAPTISQAEEVCQLYGVNDGGLNNSQFFTVNSETLKVETLGSLHEGKDIEALAINETGVLYAASGDDTDKPGHLYTVNTETGELTDKGSTGYKEIEGLAFDSEGKLWAWAKDDGLITIDTQNGVGTMVKEFPGVLIEDITWNNAGTHIYASQNTNLWVYEHATQTANLACSNLPGETEALEMLPDGSLLLGIHGVAKIIQFQALNVETCEIVFGVDIPTLPGINDVEGIAWPKQACSTGGAQEEQAPEEKKWVLWDGKNVEGSFKLYEGSRDGDVRGECIVDNEEGKIFKTNEEGEVFEEGEKMGMLYRDGEFGLEFGGVNWDYVMYVGTLDEGIFSVKDIRNRYRFNLLDCLIVYKLVWSTTTD